MSKAIFDSNSSERSTPAQDVREMLARLAAAAALPDDQINLTDPDAPAVDDWDGAVRGRFYKPVKRLKSFRIDADVLAYFEAQGRGYQTEVNRVLRAEMLRGMREQARQAKAPSNS